VKVYLASRYSRRLELCRYRDRLDALGFPVTSRWLNGDHQVTDAQLDDDGTEPLSTELRRRFALEDWEDLRESDVVMAFTEPPRTSASRGGRHVELGAALAWGKRVYVVGPRENVFCCLPNLDVCSSFEEALGDLIATRDWPAEIEADLELHGLKRCPRACHGFGRCPLCGDTGTVPIDSELR